MIVNDPYYPALIEPCHSSKANRLFIVSGYASATFARRHIVDLLKAKDDFEINLIIGMPNNQNDHMAFLSLHKDFIGKFKGYYFQSQPSVHCKVYSWFHNNLPIIGLAGSANYSQSGFFSNQQLNQLSNEDPTTIKLLYDELLQKSIFIPNHTIMLPEGHRISIIGSVRPGSFLWEIPDKRVRISFLDKKGILPTKSGLNWGQRLEKKINKVTGTITYVKREPNQAYISLKGDSRKEGFFPEQAFTFSLITDDNYTLDCVIAQDGRKAIETTNDNSLIGKYFRQRFGIPYGEPVTAEDLERYGRTDYTIEKIDNETFLLDLSV
jgi:hypothetical protein